MVDLQRYLQLLEYELALQEAEEDLIRFAEVTMPDMRYPEDPSRTRYMAARHHRMMADLMMRIERGEDRKVILNTAPRHGKTELCTKRFAAWYSGRNPHHDIIVATYNEKFAEDFGKDVREIMASQRFRQIFPDYSLKAQSNEMLKTYAGGDIFFLGRRSSTTGRGGNLIIVDDPTKDDKEVKYQSFREDCWQWFTQTLLTRRHDDKAAIILTQCMTGDTPVLRPDGTETPLRDLRVGDVVATYDDGRLSSSRVLGFLNNGPDDTLKIRMTSGAEVRANARHPFLVKREGRLEWVRLKNIRRGDVIVRVNGANGRASHANGTAATEVSKSGGIATRITASGGGLLATDLRPPKLTASRASQLNSSIATASCLMTTSVCWLNRAAAVLFAGVALPRLETLTTGQMSCALTIATTQGKSGGFFATTAISPLVEGSHQKFWSAWQHTSDFTEDTVAEITADAREDVYDIQIERTENFIANGLVSHNTRWHEDDIVGRITDKTNPAYSKKFSDGFKIINLPAIAEGDDPLGRKQGEPLWPERFGLPYLEEMREANAAAFAALYQCDPTPDDGVFFRQEEIHEYSLADLPQKLTMYCVSDHAVGTKDVNDPSCMVPFGICENGDAWVMPQIAWKRMDGQEAVEEMINIMKTKSPVFWYAEKGHITKSLGPFLNKRMQEEGVYTPIIEEHPVGDKIQRAQSGRARCAQGKIKFPSFAPWWPRAKAELLKFPNGRFDDFVDCVSMIGSKVGYHVGPGKVIQKSKFEPGTFGYMLKEFKERDYEREAAKAASGWGRS